MRLVSEYLDIMNLFRKSHQEEQILEKINKKDLIEMSDECKKGISKKIKIT